MQTNKAILGALILFLSACTGAGGDEYLGKWVDAKSEKNTLEIIRNGEGFIINKTEPSFLTGKVTTDQIPAVLKDGLLQVNGGAAALTHVKASDVLLIPNFGGGSNEYKRVK